MMLSVTMLLALGSLSERLVDLEERIAALDVGDNVDEQTVTALSTCTQMAPSKGKYTVVSLPYNYRFEEGVLGRRVATDR